MQDILREVESDDGQSNRDLLRFATCGSVDDGKSSLIGRLLYDTRQIHDDQLSALQRDSRKYGTVGEEVDLALLMDGLEAEREQSITIDVGYRYFSTTKRSFIIADSPGHEQFTRNMATAASNSELAVILVDARKGVTVQTQRHAAICSIFGVSHIVLAVNKMDLVDFSQETFEQISDAFHQLADRLNFVSIKAIPVSAKFGDNVATESRRMPWFRGGALLAYLEAIDVRGLREKTSFRLAVQWVNRPNAEYRGFSGTVTGGTICKGDDIIVLPGRACSKIRDILVGDEPSEQAGAGDAVTLRLQDEIDVARGDVLASANSPPDVSDQFAAHLLWMGSEALFPGRSYLMRVGTRWVSATVSLIKHRLDVSHLEHLAAKSLGLNEIGFCNVMTARPVVFDPFEQSKETGSFILVDRYSNQTVGAGTISFRLMRGDNLHAEALAVDKGARAKAKNQRPCVLWFTGLSGAGKSTIARLVEAKLHLGDCHTYMLDGDNIRRGLNHDLGFTVADRIENIRRVGEVSKLFVDAGLIVLCSFISPFRAERQSVRDLFGSNEFVEIFVDASLGECIRRDPKGLYAKAKAGDLKNFTGIDSSYEPPDSPELRLATEEQSADDLANAVVGYLKRGGYIH
jgi:bifunctional enzyme CysN/CysC